MWAFEESGVVPDVLIAGKGLASGYPISLIASRREVLDTPPFGRPGAGASTFASGNLACAAGAATLGLLEDGERAGQRPAGRRAACWRPCTSWPTATPSSATCGAGAC